MNAANLQIYLQVQSIIIRVEAMKATNADRINAQHAYTEEDFTYYADMIDSLLSEVSHV